MSVALNRKVNVETGTGMTQTRNGGDVPPDTRQPAVGNQPGPYLQTAHRAEMKTAGSAEPIAPGALVSCVEMGGVQYA